MKWRWRRFSIGGSTFPPSPNWWKRPWSGYPVARPPQLTISWRWIGNRDRCVVNWPPRRSHRGLNMGVLQNVIALLVLIGVMILIHELGHFWAARYFDVGVEVFSFGFGPRLFGFRRGDTDYRFSAILFGGYVKMMGEHPGDEDSADPRGFMTKPKWQRLIIAFAGPFMNIVLAVGLLTGLFMVKYQKLAEPDQRAVIGHVVKDSAAAKAGLQEGDRIVALNREKNPSWDDITLKEIASAYNPMHITVERAGSTFD